MAFVKIEFLFNFWIFFANNLMNSCATFGKFLVLVLTSIIQSKIKIKTGIIFIFQWNSHHHSLNIFKHNYVVSKTLGHEWIVKRDEDCWYVCGEKGGSCSVCQLYGENGYCCSQTRFNLNGDCPTEAVNAMISSSDSEIEMHQCVRKISSGKWLLSKMIETLGLRYR